MNNKYQIKISVKPKFKYWDKKQKLCKNAFKNEKKAAKSNTTTNYSLQKNTSHHNLIFELTSIKLYFRILCTMLSTSRPTKVKLSLNMSKEKTTKKYTWGSSSI